MAINIKFLVISFGVIAALVLLSNSLYTVSFSNNYNNNNNNNNKYNIDIEGRLRKLEENQETCTQLNSEIREIKEYLANIKTLMESNTKNNEINQQFAEIKALIESNTNIDEDTTIESSSSEITNTNIETDDTETEETETNTDTSKNTNTKTNTNTQVKQSKRLFVGILASYKNYDRREAVRETVLNLPTNTKYVNNYYYKLNYINLLVFYYNLIYCMNVIIKVLII